MHLIITHSFPGGWVFSVLQKVRNYELLLQREFYFFILLIMRKSYISKEADKDGIFDWTHEENRVWHALISRQLQKVEKYAHPKFVEWLKKLNLDIYHVPQHKILDACIFRTTGWHIQAVPSIINEEIFFGMLSQKIFPVTSFIRRLEDLDYIEEPDIFHEVFWHLPLLTWNEYGDFLEKFWKTYLSLWTEERIKMGRLFWFTVEFWLILESEELKIYWAGILSSYNETPRSIDNEQIQRSVFDLKKCICTKYRYDTLQNEYFVLESFDELFSLLDQDLISILNT